VSAELDATLARAVASGVGGLTEAQAGAILGRAGSFNVSRGHSSNGSLTAL
jgi:hypothetical protein